MRAVVAHVAGCGLRMLGRLACLFSVLSVVYVICD